MQERSNQKKERENIIWQENDLHLKLADFLWDSRHCSENIECIHLGIKYVASDDQTAHIKDSLKWCFFKIHLFFEWLHINDHTPMHTKLEVLGACMFSAYLYGVDTWHKIDDVGSHNQMAS